MTRAFPFSNVCFWQDNTLCHKTQIISEWFLEHDIEFTVLTHRQTEFNTVHLECGWTGNLHHGCAAKKSVANVRCCHVNLRNVFSTLLNLYHEGFKTVLD